MERIDDLGNGYKIIQDTDGFCFGTDSVLLSDFAVVKYNHKVLDMCSGNGIIPILLCAKSRSNYISGIEIQKSPYDLAVKSIELNNLSERITYINDDVKNAFKYFNHGSIDVVTCNPPYMIGQHGLTNPDAPKAIARHEILCTLEDVISQAAKVLKPGGHFYMVHRPFRLAEIMTTMSQYKLEPKRMQLVYPFVNKEPNMVLIEAARGGRPRMTVEKPLIVYKEPGVYTDEIYEVYGY